MIIIQSMILTAYGYKYNIPSNLSIPQKMCRYGEVNDYQALVEILNENDKIGRKYIYVGNGTILISIVGNFCEHKTGGLCNITMKKFDSGLKSKPEIGLYVFNLK